MNDSLVDLAGLQTALQRSGISEFAAQNLWQATNQRLGQVNHGDLARWQEALASIEKLIAAEPAWFKTVSGCTATDTVSIEAADPLGEASQQQLMQALRSLKPWRKGPYNIAGIHIDTEWRSDWNWQRLCPHITPLEDRLVLDVGCGNGYHGWRMRGAGARLVIGIDPSLLFLCQFQALQHFLQDATFHLLPLRMESLPPQLESFDTVFSMGVLYHRRDYQAHLEELRDAMRPGGELVLETLILDGTGESMVEPASQSPKASTPSIDPTGATNSGRYARMRNVWALPSEALLHRWLQQAGFEKIRTVDINTTSIAEQRSTDWMPFESLAEALDPDDHSLTIEGWPAPRRALVLAERPVHHA